MKYLAELQSWLMDAIKHQGNVSNDDIDKTIVSDKGGGLSSSERLNIYASSFYGRLHQIMQGEYPALRHAMEDDLFNHFVAEYLKAYPPSSYTLYDLGKHFPKYLRETRPPNDEELWPEFIIELATLERAFQEAYHGKGVEGTDSSLGENFAEISAEATSNVLHTSFPVHEYFLAYRSGQSDIPIPEPKNCTVAIYRRNYKVYIIEGA